MGIKPKAPPVVDPNIPPPILTREEQEFADMDKYYTNYNWELPDQTSMKLPPRSKKGKKEGKSPATDPPASSPTEEAKSQSHAIALGSFVDAEKEEIPVLSIEFLEPEEPNKLPALLQNLILSYDEETNRGDIVTYPSGEKKVDTTSIVAPDVVINSPGLSPESIQVPPRTTSRRKSRLSISMADQVILESPLEV